jgi:hypothetical protein
MNARHEQIAAYAAITIFSIIGFLCVLMIIAQLPNWGDKKPEWIGALGTIAAFAGTIWIATSDRRKQRLVELNLATVAAAELFDRLKTYRGMLEGTAEKIGDADDIPEARLLECMVWFDNAELWTREEILPLTALPDHVAPRMQRLAVRHHRMIEWMSQLQAAKRHEFKTHRHKTLRSELAKSIDDVHRCITQFKKLLDPLYDSADYFS